MADRASPARAAFIDRDGVINEERNYVYRIEDFVLLDGVVEGLLTLQNAGFRLIVVTNQAGIARGLYTEADYQRLTQHLQSLLAGAGVRLSGVYHCPHHPTAGVGALRVDCECRKPRPGMLLQAARELDIDLHRSVVIGDKQSDVEAGRAAGVERCVLVRSGHELSAAQTAVADVCVDDLLAAARWLVKAPTLPC